MVGSRLPPLTAKLLRDLWRLRGQAVAIALVMAAGVGMVIMSFGMIRSLETTRGDYYRRYSLADVWAPIRRAPDSMERSFAAIPGIAVSESRLSAGATLDIPGVVEPATARIHSLPRRLNRLVLREGRLPHADRPDEVVASEAFARAARIGPGSTIRALIHGKSVELRVVGTALSPEYVYAVAPGQIFPDNRRFGVLWMAREPLGAALDMQDGFNEFVALLAPGASRDEVIRRLDIAMADWGASGAYGRDLQISDRFVSNEIDQLRTMVGILPPIFLGVAAFLLNIMLARLVDTEREVIGLLKAFGYRNGAVIRHYAQLAILLSLGGLVIGAGGGTWLGRALARMYQDYFTFPYLHFIAGLPAYLVAAGTAMLAAVSGAAGAVWRAYRLLPADAMRPPAPARFEARGPAEAAAHLVADQPSRMIIRGLARRPLRSAATVFGLSCALSLYIASASATDNVDRMVELAFDRGQRADITLAFVEPRDARIRRDLETLPGVRRIETFRTASARIVAGSRRSRESLMGMEPDASLVRTVDLGGNPVPTDPRGAILSSQLARKLDVKPGDMLSIAITEGERPRFSLPVVRIIDAPLGGAILVERRTLNRLLHEGDVATGAHLAVDPARIDALHAELKRIPMVAGVSIRSAAMRGIRETVAENMGIITLFNTGFAVLIVAGVVFTSARTSLSERARDIASMRVLGFRKREAAFVLLGELAMLVLMAIPLGIALGVGLARFIASRFSNDLFMIPAATSARTIAEGVVIFMVAALATAWLIRRSADGLDLVRALKTRE